MTSFLKLNNTSSFTSEKVLMLPIQTKSLIYRNLNTSILHLTHFSSAFPAQFQDQNKEPPHAIWIQQHLNLISQCLRQLTHTHPTRSGSVLQTPKLSSNTPIIKNSSPGPDNPNNVHAISNLHFLEKKHLTSNKLLESFQSGFVQSLALKQLC